MQVLYVTSLVPRSLSQYRHCLPKYLVRENQLAFRKIENLELQVPSQRTAGDVELRKPYYL